MHKIQSSKNATPAIIRLGRVETMDSNIYDHSERYDYVPEMLEEGKYWTGSQTSNTRCNKFTLIGGDKKMADDTKEKK